MFLCLCLTSPGGIICRRLRIMSICCCDSLFYILWFCCHMKQCCIASLSLDTPKRGNVMCTWIKHNGSFNQGVMILSSTYASIVTALSEANHITIIVFFQVIKYCMFSPPTVSFDNGLDGLDQDATDKNHRTKSPSGAHMHLGNLQFLNSFPTPSWFPASRFEFAFVHPRSKIPQREMFKTSSMASTTTPLSQTKRPRRHTVHSSSYQICNFCIVSPHPAGFQLHVLCTRSCTTGPNFHKGDVL